MKQILWLAVLPLLTGCMVAQTAETRLTACPVAGLQSLAFYVGAPSGGNAIASQDSDGKILWNFGYDAGDIYVVCTYDGDEETVQKIPSSIISCTADKNGADGFSRLGCAAHI